MAKWTSGSEPRLMRSSEQVAKLDFEIKNLRRARRNCSDPLLRRVINGWIDERKQRQLLSSARPESEDSQADSPGITRN